MTTQHTTTFKPLSNLELAAFCRQMSIILHAGISPLEGLSLLREDAVSDAEKALLQQMLSQMEETGSFYTTAKVSGAFPPYALQMICLGEETGTLDDGMTSLAQHYTREENLRRMILSSLLYPCIMISMMAAVVVVLLVKVLPIFQQVFAQLGQSMTGFSASLLALGQTLSHYSVVCILVVAALLVLLFCFRKRLPFQKQLQTLISACRFAEGLSISLKCGMTTEQSFDLAADLVEDPTYLESIQACRQTISQGEELWESVQKHLLFDNLQVRMLHIAEKAGTIDETLEQIASEYEAAVDEKIASTISKLEPTLVIVLSLIVGIILFSVMLPLLGIMSGF